MDSTWDRYLSEARQEVEDELNEQVEAGFKVAVDRGLNISREDIKAILIAIDNLYIEED